MRLRSIVAIPLAMAAGGAAAACAAIAGIPDRFPAFCQTQDAGYLLCEDFEAPVLDPAWAVTAAPGDTLALDDTTFSLPSGRSLLTTHPAGTPSDGVFLDRTFSAVIGSLHLGFDLLVDELDPTMDTYVLQLAVGKRGFALLLSDHTLVLQEIVAEGPWGPVHAAGSVADRTWTHIEVDVAYEDGGATTETVTIDGQSWSDQIMNTWSPGGPELNLGPKQIPASGAELHYDNVVLYGH